MDIEFNSVSELYNRLLPALRSKVTELKNNGYDYLNVNDVWNYLKDTRWQNSHNLTLSDMVSDILYSDNELIDANSTVGYWDKDRNFVYNSKDAKFKTFAQFIQKRVKFKLTSNKFGRYDKLFEENHIPNGYLIRKSILKKRDILLLKLHLKIGG